MVMGMQSVFVMGGENLPPLPAAYGDIYMNGGNFAPWNASEIMTIDSLQEMSYWKDN